MAIVTLPLPNQIADGQVIDAVPVMADLNYIATQVNANAQPLSTGPLPIEWQPLGQTPTFVNTTTFTVPGNLTATLPIGRRLQTTNTAGTIYSTIVSSVFTALTTVTVLNDSGVLDVGLSAVNFGILNSTNPSAPRETVLAVIYGSNTEVFSTGVTLTLSTANGFTAGASLDRYSEFAPATGIWTASKPGTYLVFYSGGISINGVTLTAATLVPTVTGSFGTQQNVVMGITSVNAAFQVIPASNAAVIIGSAGITFKLGINVLFSAGAPKLNQASLTIVGPL